MAVFTSHRRLKDEKRHEATTRISAYVSNGRLVSDMPNYWVGATGTYYFPGLYTLCSR
jgi:hypothetical protein